MCAEEFNQYLAEAKKSPIDEKINSFGAIIEKIMTIVLKIPDLVDNSIAGLNQKISNLESRVTSMNNQLNTLQSKVTNISPGGGSGGAPGGPPPGGPPSSSKSPGGPPPGGPPGGPTPGGPTPGGPTPGGPTPGGPKSTTPANPVSLRGAIMGELKELFKKKNR